MNTIELTSNVELVEKEVAKNEFPIYQHFIRFTESQDRYRSGWFMASLLWEGVLCLPVPAYLMYYYNAPIWTLIITVLLFFTNLIAGMGGSKFGTLLTLLLTTTLVHVVMILAFVL